MQSQNLNVLTQTAESVGLPAALQHYYGGNIRLALPFTKRTCAASINELMFSVRSQNALKRAGLFTVGDVVQTLEANELNKIRNLGRKSTAEIKTHVTTFGFEALSSDGKRAFFHSLMAENSEKAQTLCTWEESTWAGTTAESRYTQPAWRRRTHGAMEKPGTAAEKIMKNFLRRTVFILSQICYTKHKKPVSEGHTLYEP